MSMRVTARLADESVRYADQRLRGQLHQPSGLDNVTTIPLARLGQRIGTLDIGQETDLLQGLQAASGLLPPTRHHRPL